MFLVIGAHTNWSLLREGDAVTLVDAAWPKDYELVVESLDRIGVVPDQVEAVVLTHAHPDHIGVAERFRTDHGVSQLGPPRRHHPLANIEYVGLPVLAGRLYGSGCREGPHT